jgi:hypothetical protein
MLGIGSLRQISKKWKSASNRFLIDVEVFGSSSLGYARA